MRRFYLLTVMTAVLLLFFYHSAEAAGFSIWFSNEQHSSDSITGNMSADIIMPNRCGDSQYLFLPAGWNTDSVYVYFTGAQQITINGQSCASGDKLAIHPTEKLNIKYGKSSLAMRVMQSEHIPALFITTASGNIEALKADKTVREAGSCMVLSGTGETEYNGTLSYIRTRGNASFYYAKKSFQIKLEKATPLFGMNADRKWVLLANYVDKSLLRNTLAYGIVRYADAYSFVPDSQPVDLYLNHLYYGSFLLTEKCEIDPDRLDIDNLEERTEDSNPQPLENYPTFGERLYALKSRKGSLLDSEPADITGGYLVLANSRVYYAWEKSGFVTSRGQSFTLDSPKYASQTQVGYVAALFQRIENALFSKDGNDPETGLHWSKLLDEKTFIHRYLLSEITADYDGQKPYFYKDIDAKDPIVYCGPVWDQDCIFGANSKYYKPASFYICNDRSLSYLWFPQAMKLDDFRRQAIQTYRSIYAPALRILLGEEKDPRGLLLSLDEYAEEIAASAEMDNIRWPIGKNRGTNFNMHTGGTPKENVEYLRSFIKKRMDFLDRQWGE